MTDGYWWVSTLRMTFAVEVKGGKIATTAPIARKFVGQPTENLVRWLTKQGGFRCEPLKG